MEKHNYLNVGCGSKFNEEWVNIDLHSKSPFVIPYNIIEGLPFKNNTFDVVYHSQVLEHIPKENAVGFLNECFRVLKPGGIIRVVVPDLENIVKEYLKYLKENLISENPSSAENYNWILLELLDQTVRNYSGGQMAEYLKQEILVNEKYIFDRIGFVASSIRENFLKTNMINSLSLKTKKSFIKRMKCFRFKYLRKGIIDLLLTKQEKLFLQTGKFRHDGEIHYWFYDRYSLKKKLEEVGFINIMQQSPEESNIPNWSNFELDKKDGKIFDPSSLFMEAIKP